jgi:hypothetical protein
MAPALIAFCVTCRSACTLLQLKQEVESLLQRTDSILSRSSGHSTLHGASAGLMPGYVCRKRSWADRQQQSAQAQQNQHASTGPALSAAVTEKCMHVAPAQSTPTVSVLTLVSAACLCSACAACRLTINTASGPGSNAAALPQELAGFDFETGMQALDTPTFSKSGSREAGGSFTRRCVLAGTVSAHVRADQHRPCARACIQH